MDVNYLELITAMAKAQKIQLCIIGQDPYASHKACGIPFCTKTFEQLLDGQTSGKKVLESIGYEEISELEDVYTTPSALFYDIAVTKGVVFVNLSPRSGALIYNKDDYHKLRNGRDLNTIKNLEVISQELSRTEVVLRNSKKILSLSRTYNPHLEYILQMKIPAILHPSGKNEWRDDYDLFWDKGSTYIKDHFL